MLNADVGDLRDLTTYIEIEYHLTQEITLMGEFVNEEV